VSAAQFVTIMRDTLDSLRLRMDAHNLLLVACEINGPWRNHRDTLFAVKKFDEHNHSYRQWLFGPQLPIGCRLVRGKPDP